MITLSDLKKAKTEAKQRLIASNELCMTEAQIYLHDIVLPFLMADPLDVYLTINDFIMSAARDFGLLVCPHMNTQNVLVFEISIPD